MMRDFADKNEDESLDDSSSPDQYGDRDGYLSAINFSDFRLDLRQSVDGLGEDTL